ncbi:hypothetical protein [Crateriforma conspicua]|uniref:Tetratricopeptide repeat protein n=1 Tax=Crateriforma conspicua TaxID=2527996 RepID=A0A5C6FMR4_9PLAN|nr:hypothetical protein [Crateriforma conspicua]TWU63415.1 hypothetical protein V7x_51550 [Crateriforma conspicua]
MEVRRSDRCRRATKSRRVWIALLSLSCVAAGSSAFAQQQCVRLPATGETATASSPIFLPPPTPPSLSTTVAARQAKPEPRRLPTLDPGGADVSESAEPRWRDPDAIRLRSQSVQSLYDAAASLQRGSVFTAEHQAWSALQQWVASRDAAEDTTIHSRQLNRAVDAVREAEDFGGRFDGIDADAIARMIEAHQTVTLKDRPATSLTADQATKAYLAEAERNLIAACGNSPEAGDALLVLARIRNRRDEGNRHFNARVAITFQKAAVMASPQSAIARRDLGASLLKQGMVPQAIESLLMSNQLAPTRQTTELLMTAAGTIGHAPLVQACHRSLQDTRLPSDFPVVQLSPQAFAQTSARRGPSVSPPTQIATRPGPPSEATPTPAWYQFWRR